jgi:LDH2 family malate/lactate/ureidoglycolate dehydrogenase
VEKLAAAGFVSLGSSGSSELVAPYGGAEPRFGTNPLAVAFPSANEPLVIDLATSAIPAFELARRRMFGGTLPPGAALDDQGHDTDDPGRTKALKTFGDSPKSSAMALMVEVLTGPLVKASFA